jgi:hypothetical protein
VDLAWRDLPKPHQGLLESIGASQWRVVDQRLGGVVSDLLFSAGCASLSRQERCALDEAAGVWVQQLRVVVIDANHQALRDLDEASYEAMVARIAWHEWGHALGIVRITADEVRAGNYLMSLAPSGVKANIRRSGYRESEYTHELIAELYALLMSRRRRGQVGRPPWLDERLYRLVGRVCGWTD